MQPFRLLILIIFVSCALFLFFNCAKKDPVEINYSQSHLTLKINQNLKEAVVVQVSIQDKKAEEIAFVNEIVKDKKKYSYPLELKKGEVYRINAQVVSKETKVTTRLRMTPLIP